MGIVESKNVGVAFAAVCAAGASTAIGAGVVFFPRLVKLASRRVLAASLGFAAGVMAYVSFVEIFQKSVESFTEHAKSLNFSEEKSDSRGYVFGTLSFFGGVLFMVGLDKLVHRLSDIHDHSPLDDQDDTRDANVPPCFGCSEDPGAELDTWQSNAAEEVEIEESRVENSTAIESGNSILDDNKNKEQSDVPSMSEDGRAMDPDLKIDTTSLVREKNENAKLQNMGLQTGIAIALHNFPEGLATFVAVLNEPKVGVILAIAIAIHNIPEGLCVSLPVYYATGNRKKAFLWGALSGITEPFGALCGWLIFANSFNDVVYGLMFGLVAGMMVMISFRELLPTAHKFDPNDTVVTYSAVIGIDRKSVV